MFLVASGVIIETLSRALQFIEGTPFGLSQALTVVALILIASGSIDLVLRASRSWLLIGIIVPATLLLLVRPIYLASLGSGEAIKNINITVITGLNLIEGIGLGGCFVALYLLLFDLVETKKRVAGKESALQRERTAHEQTGSLYRELVENATEVICRVDAQGVFEYVSPSIERVLGYAPDDLVGKNCMEFVDEKNRDAIYAFYAARIRGLRTDEYIEFTMTRKDGTEARLGQTARILRNEAGTVTGYISVTRDLTAQHIAEQAQREIASRYRVLADAMGVVHWEASLPSWTFSYITPRVQDILGYSPRDWYAPGFWASILHPDDREEAMQFCSSQTERLCDHELEYRLISKSGEAVWIRDYVQVVVENGEAVGLRGFLVDISALKSAETEKRALEQARQRNERLESLGLLAGSIAHDFNNLLVCLIGHAELAQMGLPEGHRSRKHAETILDIGRQAAEFCGQLMAYSGSGALTLRNVHMNDMVREVVRLTTPPDREAGSIIFQFAENLPSFSADIAQLRQVTMNLFTNALDATATSGSLVLSTGQMECSEEFLAGLAGASHAHPGTYLYLEVKDTGCGMSEEELGHVLEPFYTTKEHGTGLGLAGAQGILRSHGGFITIASRLGAGTTTRVYFPLENVKPDRMGADGSGAEDAFPMGSILVIDDDKAILNFARVVLERNGFEVLTAAGAIDGISCFEEHAAKIRVVLMDLNMPKMNGDEAARKIQEIDSSVPILLMSGMDREDAEAAYDMDGIAGFVTKPFQFKDIERELAAVSKN